MKLTPNSISLVLGVGAIGLATISSAQAQTLTNRYSFNDAVGSTTAVDSVGGVNATLANGASIVGGALVTDGTGGGKTTQYADLGNTFNLPSGGAFSIEDFYTPGATNNQYATTFSFASDQKNFILGDENRGGNATPTVGLGDGTTEVVVPGSVLAVPTKPIDFLFTYSGTTASIYVNGVLSGTATDPAVLTSFTGFNGIAGGNPYGDGGLNGTTQDFRIFKGALTASQAAAEFNAGSENVAVGAAAPVPEASTTISFGLLMALGLGGIAIARKRQVSNQA